jgi:Family of unknown function (DUF6364)
MPTTELTLNLPEEEVEFLKDYAEQHGVTVTDLVARYVKLLQKVPVRPPHPANLQFTGVVPEDVDVRELYLQHMLEKHR